MTKMYARKEGSLRECQTKQKSLHWLVKIWQHKRKVPATMTENTPLLGCHLPNLRRAMVAGSQNMTIMVGSILQWVGSLSDMPYGSLKFNSRFLNWIVNRLRVRIDWPRHKRYGPCDLLPSTSWLQHPASTEVS